MLNHIMLMNVIGGHHPYTLQCCSGTWVNNHTMYYQTSANASWSGVEDVLLCVNNLLFNFSSLLPANWEVENPWNHFDIKYINMSVSKWISTFSIVVHSLYLISLCLLEQHASKCAEVAKRLHWSSCWSEMPEVVTACFQCGWKIDFSS